MQVSEIKIATLSEAQIKEAIIDWMKDKKVFNDILLPSNITLTGSISQDDNVYDVKATIEYCQNSVITFGEK